MLRRPVKFIHDVFMIPDSYCPGCQINDKESLLTVTRVPRSCGQLFATSGAALQAESCKLEITSCHACGHIWNSAYEGGSENLYNDDYYSSFVASEQGRQYQEALAVSLDRLVKVPGKTVLEIGCGDGHFLKLLSTFGANAIGFEPSSSFQIAKNQQHIEVHQAHFDFDGGTELSSRVDLVVMRHVLEHLAAPLKVLESLRTGIQDRPGPRFLFLEVPNASQLLKENLYFDFYNDHVQYFSQQSLAHMSKSAGWTPMAWIEGRVEFLRLVCVNTDDNLDSGVTICDSGLTSREDTASSVARFRKDFEGWNQQLTKIITKLRDNGQRIAVWGAGARGVSLLSSAGISEESFEYVVDSDTNKQGKYATAMNKPIYTPDYLRQDPVDCVLVTSYTYFDEIFAQLEWFRSSGGQVIRVYPKPEII